MLAKLEAAQRSVYVRGFSREAKEADIKAVFEQFGTVKMVAVEQEVPSFFSCCVFETRDGNVFIFLLYRRGLQLLSLQRWTQL